MIEKEIVAVDGLDQGWLGCDVVGSVAVGAVGVMDFVTGCVAMPVA